jgi:organic radical activating enzyme
MTGFDISSFTAASTLPKKIISNESIIKLVKEHTIRPIHVQLNPTNVCPLHCSFCSCDKRNKKDVMDLDLAKQIINEFHIMGTEAITITGGGDPLAYPHINELIDYITKKHIDIGLVTNGVLFNKLKMESLKKLTWCRISVSDEQKLNKEHLTPLMEAKIDWAFSYVLTDNDNLGNLLNCIIYANKYNFSHIRIVDNILSNKASNIDKVQDFISYNDVNDCRVIYQGRKNYTKGHKRCLISLLKPNIDPLGNWLPCCGIQYAQKKPSYDFTKEFVMSTADDMYQVYAQQKYFDGSRCVKCYYSDYNNILNLLWDSGKLMHQKFI